MCVCVCVCASFPFGFEGGMRDLIVLVLDRCQSFFYLFIIGFEYSQYTETKVVWPLFKAFGLRD